MMKMSNSHFLHFEPIIELGPPEELPCPTRCEFCGQFTTEESGGTYDMMYGVLCRKCNPILDKDAAVRLTDGVLASGFYPGCEEDI